MKAKTTEQHQQAKRRIVESVSKVFGITPNALLGPRRTWEIAEARHVAFLMFHRMGISSVASSRMLNRFNHGTALNSLRRAKDLASVDQTFASKLDEVHRMVFN